MSDNARLLVKAWPFNNSLSGLIIKTCYAGLFFLMKNNAQLAVCQLLIIDAGMMHVSPGPVFESYQFIICNLRLYIWHK